MAKEEKVKVPKLDANAFAQKVDAFAKRVESSADSDQWCGQNLKKVKASYKKFQETGHTRGIKIRIKQSPFSGDYADVIKSAYKPAAKK